MVVVVVVVVGVVVVVVVVVVLVAFTSPARLSVGSANKAVVNNSIADAAKTTLMRTCIFRPKNSGRMSRTVFKTPRGSRIRSC